MVFSSFRERCLQFYKAAYSGLRVAWHSPVPLDDTPRPVSSFEVLVACRCYVAALAPRADCGGFRIGSGSENLLQPQTTFTFGAFWPTPRANSLLRQPYRLPIRDGQSNRPPLTCTGWVLMHSASARNRDISNGTQSRVWVWPYGRNGHGAGGAGRQRLQMALSWEGGWRR